MTSLTGKSDRLAAILRERIASGQLAEGARLPAEWELAGHFAVSRTTVRKALRELETAGLIVRQRGRGTFVAAEARARLRRLQPAPRLRVGLALQYAKMNNGIFQGIVQALAEQLDPRVELRLFYQGFLKPEVYRAAGVDLLLVDGGFPRSVIGRLAAEIGHVIVINRVWQEVNFICTDNVAGGRLMARHALACGHRRFGILHYGEETEQEFVHRLAGMRAALTAGAAAVAEAAMSLHDLPAFTPFAAIEQLLRQDSGITVFLCVCDHLAAMAYEVLAERGLRVPDDISVIGFDGMPSAAFLAPPLTTVEQPCRLIGKRLCEVTDQLLAGVEPSCRELVLPTLLARESVRQLPLS